MINKKCHKLDLDSAKQYVLDDTQLKNLLPKLCLVSSKQLARILNKKNDRSLRSLRSQEEGFPFRCKKLEDALSNNFSPSAVDSITISSKGFNSDIHASADYRAHIIKVMAKKAISSC